MAAGSADRATGPHAVVPMEEFRLALEREEVLLHFQPQVDLTTGEVRGAEALIRWQHGSGGLLPPHDFLPALAHTPLMPTITAWVMHNACAVAVQWAGHRVAVNIAGTDAMHSGLIDSVHRALGASGLSPERLTLEVTEHSLVHDLDRATGNLRRLSDDGVRISLDDFGTGYSSLLYLRELPITEIKIDGRFVAGIGHSRDDDGIVAGLVKLGHAVGVHVVAEGVETAEQATSLIDLGCDFAQGYLYGRPAAEFAPESVVVEHYGRARQVERRRRRERAIASAEARDVIRVMVDEGASLHTIAAALNRQGIRTVQGTRWVGASVGRAIANL
jgi:EAL domain-containing protein (putative c-di-GMP-specific phosphodiesterase class I)